MVMTAEPYATTCHSCGTVLERGLTPREKEILTLRAAGLRNGEIAERLVISVKTVEAHVSHICSRLGAATSDQAVATALRRGYLSFDEVDAAAEEGHPA